MRMNKSAAGKAKLLLSWEKKHERLKKPSLNIKNDPLFKKARKVFEKLHCSHCPIRQRNIQKLRSLFDSMFNGRASNQAGYDPQQCQDFCNSWGIELIGFCQGLIDAQPPFIVGYRDGQLYKVLNKYSKIPPSRKELSFYDQEMYASPYIKENRGRKPSELLLRDKKAMRALYKRLRRTLPGAKERARAVAEQFNLNPDASEAYILRICKLKQYD